MPDDDSHIPAMNTLPPEGTQEQCAHGEHPLAWKANKQARGIAYAVTFWVADALSDDTISHWQDRKSELLDAMAQAGQKGAYGKLRALSQQAESLFATDVEPFLRAGAGTSLSAIAREQLIAGFQTETDACLLGWCLCPNHVHAILELTEETGIDSLVSRWEALCPDVRWSTVRYTEAIPAQDSEDKIDILLAEAGANRLEPENAPSDTDRTPLDFRHVTVLLHEAVDMLRPSAGKVIVDCTLGGGGHTELLLEHGASVLGIDQDPEARRSAMKRLSRFGTRFKTLAGNFRDIESLLIQQGISSVDGILADLGVSSHQLDTAERGFSFMSDGPLDMRMDTRASYSAADLVNEESESELANIIWQYGEERASRAIARAIVKARAESPIQTTSRLARIIETVLPRKGRQHPATRTFQALRIAVNHELDALDELLDASVRLLKPEGRLALITFHSLEDRRVKQFLDRHSRPELDRPEWPAPRPNPDYCFRLLTRKPIVASDEEISVNTRSRSAKLRGAEKIST